MRILMIIGVLTAATLLGGWTFDRQGAFCAYDQDYTNCGYPSFAACLAAVSGVGGHCRPNPFYAPDRQVRRQRSH